MYIMVPKEVFSKIYIFAVSTRINHDLNDQEIQLIDALERFIDTLDTDYYKDMVK